MTSRNTEAIPSSRRMKAVSPRNSLAVTINNKIGIPVKRVGLIRIDKRVRSRLMSKI